MICAHWIRFSASIMAMRQTAGLTSGSMRRDGAFVFAVVRGCIFFGGGGLARWRIAAIMAKASITRETWRCHPCQDLLSL